jgi:protein-S-isoprenylcysteine O-methyltransferase Ste14
MSASRSPVIAAAATGTYTVGIVTRMEREYRTNDTFTPVTVALLYSAYVANGAALAWAAHQQAWPLPVPAGAARLTGVALGAAGAAVSLTSMTRFASGAQLSGIEAGTLRTGGLYRYSRNPQYLGLIAALAGASLATRSGVAATITAGASAVLNRWVRSEESHLSRIFGTRYDEYREQVSRWM